MTIGNGDPGLFVRNIPSVSTPVYLPFVIGTGGVTTIASDASIEDKTVSLTDATGFVDGTRVGIFSGTSEEGRFYFGTQIGAPTVDDIDLDSPLDFPFETDDPVVAFSKDLLVDGSVSTQTFSVRAGGLGSGVYLLINRIIISMVTFSPPELGQFGDGTALTQGLVFRVNNGVIRNLNNIKSNQDFLNWGYDLSFYPVQGGVDGLGGRVTWAGEDKHGTPLLLAPDDALECLVQDDLIGNALAFNIIAEGREVPLSFLKFFGVS